MIEPVGRTAAVRLASASAVGLGSVGPGAAAPAAGAPAPNVAGADRASGGSFLDALGEALARLNDQLVAADGAAADFAAGGATDLQDAVLALNEASLGLRLGVAVRDRLLEAYQDVMRLQI